VSSLIRPLLRDLPKAPPKTADHLRINVSHTSRVVFALLSFAGTSVSTMDLVVGDVVELRGEEDHGEAEGEEYEKEEEEDYDGSCVSEATTTGSRCSTGKTTAIHNSNNRTSRKLASAGHPGVSSLSSPATSACRISFVERVWPVSAAMPKQRGFGGRAEETSPDLAHKRRRVGEPTAVPRESGDGVLPQLSEGAVREVVAGPRYRHQKDTYETVVACVVLLPGAARTLLDGRKKKILPLCAPAEAG
jgi:hypothetical protein